MDDKFPHKHKNILDLHFAMTDKYVFLKLGEASRSGAFDFYNTKLDAFKSFLLELAK